MNKLAISTIKAEIVFGSPRRDCRGLGICKVVESSSFPDKSFPCSATTIPARLTVGATNRLNIFIKDGDIPPVVLGRYFGDGCFTVETIYRFTPEMCLILGFPDVQLTVPPGVYGFRETNMGISLNLRLARARGGAGSSQLLADAC